MLLLAKQMCLAQRSIQTMILLAKNVGLDRFKKNKKQFALPYSYCTQCRLQILKLYCSIIASGRARLSL